MMIRWKFRNTLARLLIAVMICFIFFGNEIAHAVSAINQLCGAAGYGAGCVKAFKPQGMRPGVRPGVGGGNMLGGMLGSIAASLIVDLVVDAAVSSATSAAGAGAGNVPAQQLSSQTSALQRAIEQQRKFQEERQQQLLSQMVDVSASQFKDSSLDLTILENASAKAGAPFDGNMPMPDGQWESIHDAWFSTSSTGQADGIQPLKMSDRSLDYTKDSMNQMKCTGSSMGGKICPFSWGKPPVIKLNTISVPSPSATTMPGIPATPATTPTVQSQWIQYEDSIIAMARRKLVEIGEMATDPRTQAEMLLTTFVNFGSSALPGVQGEVSSQGIELYKGFMNKLIANTFEILTDAVYNPEEAIRKSDPEELARWTREALLDSAPSSVKVAVASLTGRPDVAFDESNKIIVDKAKEEAIDKIKDKAQDIAKGYLEKAEHWLLKL